MCCPFCRAEETEVYNSRSTRQSQQVWRRRRCLSCRESFTTYERLETGFLKVVKKTGRRERFSRAKLYSGLYGAYLSVADKERLVDRVTDLVETRILDLRQAEVPSQTIAEIALSVLKSENTAAFVRFLAYQADLRSESQLMRELKKY